MSANPPLKANELKQHFGVYGHFYDLKINTEYIPCRSVLELISHDCTPLSLNDLASYIPQLIVVMMNPGSSRPADPGYRPVRINHVSEISDTREWVPTRPDNTQYQIMRVMEANHLSFARILNLSDIVNAKSSLFIQKTEALSQYNDGHLHSIFCDERQTEFAKLTSNTTIPVLVGWGRIEGLRPLAEQALRKLTGRLLLGVPVEGGVLYSHPSPMLQKMKDRWLDEVNRQFKSIGSGF